MSGWISNIFAVSTCDQKRNPGMFRKSHVSTMIMSLLTQRFCKSQLNAVKILRNSFSKNASK
eukprot:7673696-Karenia_brevis.AAC.1